MENKTYNTKWANNVANAAGWLPMSDIPLPKKRGRGRPPGSKNKPKAPLLEGVPMAPSYLPPMYSLPLGMWGSLLPPAVAARPASPSIPHGGDESARSGALGAAAAAWSSGVMQSAALSSSDGVSAPPNEYSALGMPSAPFPNESSTLGMPSVPYPWQAPAVGAAAVPPLGMDSSLFSWRAPAAAAASPTPPLGIHSAPFSWQAPVVAAAAPSSAPMPGGAATTAQSSSSSGGGGGPARHAQQQQSVYASALIAILRTSICRVLHEEMARVDSEVVSAQALLREGKQVLDSVGVVESWLTTRSDQLQQQRQPLVASPGPHAGPAEEEGGASGPGHGGGAL